MPGVELMQEENARQSSEHARCKKYLQIDSSVDVYEAGRTAGFMALNAGFEESAAHEIELCATELAMNMVLHAQGGVLTVDTRLDRLETGIRLVAEDDGKGMGTPLASITDGTTSRSSLGCGLGTVQRLMDSLDIISPRTSGGGTCVSCFRALPVSSEHMSSPLDIGVASRPCTGYLQNGDASVILRDGACVLVGVIDGLGHGKFAAKASGSAKNYVTRHAHLGLREIFTGTSRICRGTRGVAMTLARIDWKRRSMELAGTGNVEVRFPAGSPQGSFVPRRGIIGVESPPVAPVTITWSGALTMVIISDGISSSWSSPDHKLLGAPSAQAIAAHILNFHSRTNDDATVLVVRDTRNDHPKNGTDHV